MRLFDFHARWSPSLVDALDSAGIGRAAVCAGGLVDLDRLARQIAGGGRSQARADNEGVARACAAAGGRLVPFFFADPGADLAAYTRAAPRFRGLEISPAVHGFSLADPAVDALVAVAAGHRHPVYVVCLGRPGTRPADLAALARRHPTVAFVSGHCGHTGLETDFAATPNVHVELSGCWTATARRAVERLGAERVLFGTEHPLQHPSVEVAKLAALGLPPRDLALVGAGNALRLLGLEAS
jgi:predicted TIM-barrel fold metal-dependent hydrolase